MTAFDESIDGMAVVEEHAAAVLKLEEEQGAKLLGVYERVAKQLRARLRSYPTDTFTAQQMRSTLAQLQGAIDALHGKLYETMDDGSTRIANKAVRDLVVEIDTFNDYFQGAVQPINLDLAQVAIEVKDRLLNNYRASLAAYSDSLRQRISDGLMTMVIERVGSEEIYRRLLEQDAIGGFFEGEAWRLRRIVRTELHGMYGGAKLAGLGRFAEEEPELRKSLYTPRDNRTGDDSKWVAREIAEGRLNGVHDGGDRDLRPKVQDPFFYSWKGRVRTFLAPPDRPNDRAILIPYHPSWD